MILKMNPIFVPDYYLSAVQKSYFIECWGPFCYKDHLFRYGDLYDKDEVLSLNNNYLSNNGIFFIETVSR